MYVNYRYKRKERDVTGTGGEVVLPVYHHRFRYRLTYSPEHIQLRTTVDYNHFHSQGWREVRDINSHSLVRMSFPFR